MSTPTSPQLAVRATGLGRSFGETIAVAELDLAVPAGAVFGLLGPDGAGKSTLIRMLATVLTPDTGEAEVFGHSVITDRSAAKPLIGYMSQKFSLYPDLTVAENLEFFARIRGVSRSERHRRAASLLESMGLTEFAGRQAQHLSGGMKQKLMLATTLMHSPDLLLLDEPTTGVDPVSRREFWRILAGLHQAGTSVIVATPYMDEAERCTQIAFIDRGRIQNQGTPSQIKALVPGRLLEVVADDPRAALAALRELPEVTSPHLFGDVVRVLWQRPDDPEQLIVSALARLGLPGAQVRATEMDMESAFAFLAESAAARADEATGGVA